MTLHVSKQILFWGKSPLIIEFYYINGKLYSKGIMDIHGYLLFHTLGSFKLI